MYKLTETINGGRNNGQVKVYENLSLQEVKDIINNVLNADRISFNDDLQIWTKENSDWGLLSVAELDKFYNEIVNGLGFTDGDVTNYYFERV